MHGVKPLSALLSLITFGMPCMSILALSLYKLCDINTSITTSWLQAAIITIRVLEIWHLDEAFSSHLQGCHTLVPRGDAAVGQDKPRPTAKLVNCFFGACLLANIIEANLLSNGRGKKHVRKQSLKKMEVRGFILSLCFPSSSWLLRF